MQSGARTVDEYLTQLPPERREVVSAVRDMVRRHLPKGYEEAMAFGMIGYGVPLSRYPVTYNRQPLAYVAIAAQKNYYSLYLMSAYADSADERAVREAFQRAGRKLDMGKSCIRFKRVEDIPLDDLGPIIARNSVDDWIATYERARGGRGGG